MTYRVGFASFDERCSFADTIKRSLQHAVVDGDFELLVRYNAQSNEQAIANAKYFLAEQVDIVVMFHRHANTLNKIRSLLFPIPMITIDLPVPLVTYFGRDNKRCGEMVGQAAVDWIAAHWSNRVDSVVVFEDVGDDDAAQTLAYTTLQTLEAANQCKEQQVYYIPLAYDDITQAGQRLAHYLLEKRHYRHMVGISYDSPGALLMLDVVREMGRERDMILLSHAADERVQAEIDDPHNPLIVASTCPAESYGAKLVSLIQQRLRGERVPAQTYITVNLLQQNSASSN